MSTGGNTKAILAAMLANAGIAVAKFVAFLVTGSASLLAESIHSLADTSNQGLLILGGKRAKKIADDRHQFGYGRERYFWGFIVAMVLFSLGGVFSIFEGIEKIRDPHELESLGWAIGVVIFAMLMEGWSFRTAAMEAAKVKGSRSYWQFVRWSRSPELPVVLLEDAGALVGLTFALAGVSLSAITGDAFWDGVGTLGIGVLLVLIAVTLTIEMQSLLIGESATTDDVATIVRVVTANEAVTRIIDLRTQHLGPDELLVAGKIEFDRSLRAPEVSRAIDQVETSIREAVPLSMRIYIEPDIYDPDRGDVPEAPVVDQTSEETG
ncbi:MAG: cation diffusion facilitator family transporter [Acidimicrobiia bacterium]